LLFEYKDAMKELDEYQKTLDHAAQVLHRDVGSALSAAGLNLELLREKYQDQEDLAKAISDVQQNLEELTGVVRKLISTLNPPD
jgi:signal transduction histidine kinase